MDNLILCCIAACAIGILLGEIKYAFKRTYGTFRIDRSDPQKDTYRIELESLDGIERKKFIVLKVEDVTDISQK